MFFVHHWSVPESIYKKIGAKKAPPIAVTGGAFTRQRSFYRQD
ncbi:hypothetical protein ECEC4402_5946, partial [Escherichia coli EC4402]